MFNIIIVIKFKFVKNPENNLFIVIWGEISGKGNEWKWKKIKAHNRLVPKFKYYIRKISKS